MEFIPDKINNFADCGTQMLKSYKANQ